MTDRSYTKFILSIAIVFSACFTPYLNFIKTNWEQISFADTLQLLMFITSIFICIVILLTFIIIYKARLLRQFTHLAIIVILLFFNTNDLYYYAIKISQYINPQSAVALMAITILSVLLIAIYIKNKIIDVFIAIYFISGMIISSTNIFFKLLEQNKKIEASNIEYSNIVNPIKKMSGENVYFIVLDGYTSNEILDKKYDFKNSNFSEMLENHGFKILKSKSNYITTALAFAGLFNIDYPILNGEKVFSNTDAFYPSLLKNDSPPLLIKMLNDFGYKFWLSGNWATGCSDIHLHCISPPPLLNYATTTFLKKTPIVYFNLSLLSEQFVEKINSNIVYTEDALTPVKNNFSKIINQGRKNFFLIHHLQPHPPYFKDENCNMRPNSNIKWDTWDPPEHYIASLKCANTMTFDLIENIIKYDPNSIIVVQADHGPSMGLSWDKPISDWEIEGIETRIAIINTIRAPKSCDHLLTHDIGPINTVRFVLACLMRSQPQYLQEMTFLSSYRGHVDFGTVVKFNSVKMPEKSGQ
jgi:hypothetical protein